MNQTENLELNTNNTQKENEAKKLKIMTHHKYFTASFIEIINIILAKSNEVDINVIGINMKLCNSHTKLRVACNDLINGFVNDDQYDQGRIIKKIYKVITMHIDNFYPTPSKSLFTLKNENGAVITIIPGLDINLVANIMDEKEMDNLWDYMYVMYISSVSIISLINEHKKGKVFDLIPQMRERVIKSGVLHKNLELSNPFFGLNSDSTTEQYNVDAMFSNVDEIQAPSGDIMDDLFKMSGVDKLVDISQLNEQLKNVKQEDINEATRSITKLLGAEHDKDVSEVCSTLVEGIVEDLQANADKGIQGMFETAKTVSKRMSGQIDRVKMGKTVDKLASFMKDGESNLKNMKDDKGNPIGEKLMNSLKGPLEMAQRLGKDQNGMPNFANMATLLQQVSSVANSANAANAANAANSANFTNATKPVEVKKKTKNQSEPINSFNE